MNRLYNSGSFYIMAIDPTNEFSDNWAYLRTELSWLDRMLMLAVARYRQDKRNVDRVAQSAADRVSSHWWKGVVSLEGNIAYDEHRKVPKSLNPSPKVGYNQQLTARIQASQEKGIVLALPALSDRLNLTPFEKNVVLIGLAPEVNRRYARLYRYLQGQDDEWTTDLPTVELVLRLLCRNDNEWRTARQQIAQQSPLLKQGLVSLLQQPYDTLLNASLKLSEPLVRYLLTEKPTLHDLDHLLRDSMTSDWLPSFSPPLFSGSDAEGRAIALPDGYLLESPHARNRPTTTDQDDTGFEQNAFDQDAAQDFSQNSSKDSPFLSASHLQCLEQPDTPWDDLVLPDALMTSLQHVCYRVDYQEQANACLGLKLPLRVGIHPNDEETAGSLVLFVGASGTGKSLAARAIATDLKEPLYWVDLSVMSPDHYPPLLVDAESVPVLLIRASHLWLSTPACALLQEDCLRHFLAQRRAQGQLTLFSVQDPCQVAPEWQREMDMTVSFPVPDEPLRQKLWEKVLSTPPHPGKSLDKSLNIELLSQLPLNGREILTLVQDGAIAAIARQSPMTLEDIRQSLERQGRSRLLRQLDRLLANPKSRRRSRSTPPKK